MSFSSIRMIKGSGAALAVMMVGAMSLSGHGAVPAKNTVANTGKAVASSQHAATAKSVQLAAYRPGM